MNSEEKAIKVFYLSICTLLSVLFLAILYDASISIYLESDLGWMIPLFFHYVNGKSFSSIVSFLISPSPLDLGLPPLKAYLFFVLSLLDLQTKHLIFAAIALHFANAGLLLLLSRNLGLGVRVAVFSALTYLTMFAHFHSYMWPTAALHLIAVFFILLVLTLYMKTDQLINADGRYRRYFFATLAVGMLASLHGRGAHIAPVLMLTHILVCSERDAERIKKYDLWLPFFVVYLVYPAIALSFVGDAKLTMFLAEIPAPPVLKSLFAFLGGVLSLLVVRAGLRTYANYQWWQWWAKLPWVLPTLLGVGLYLVLSLHDKRNVLLPYHVMVPFTSVVMTFLEPLQYALSIDSTEAYHFVPPAAGVFSVLLGLLLIGTFTYTLVLKNRQLLLLFMWYLIALGYLLFQYSSHPVRIPSRYIVYLSPMFSVIFCSVLIHVYARVMSKIPRRVMTKEVCLALVLIVLLVPNVLAIRLEMFRGKLANTYSIYDYIRTAELIKRDIGKSGDTDHVASKAIYVSNVVEMPYKPIRFWDPASIDPYKYDTFRLVVKEVFDNVSISDIHVNPPTVQTSGNETYVIQDDRITNVRGDNIDPFSRLFREAVSLVHRGRRQEAGNAFQAAIQTRPFLLNYVLGNHPLEDLRWVTGGLPMRAWINKVDANVSVNTVARKYQHVITVMNNELSDYILSLFYVSFLKHLAGDIEGSKFWLSQIQYLESDSLALSTLIRNNAATGGDQDVLSFLARLDDPSYFRNPLPWRKDDYGFQRFLVRLVFGRELIFTGTRG